MQITTTNKQNETFAYYIDDNMWIDYNQVFLVGFWVIQIILSAKRNKKEFAERQVSDHREQNGQRHGRP